MSDKVLNGRVAVITGGSRGLGKAMALALGEGGAFRAPMARAVIGGLITSTLLTLVVVPVAYTYLDGLGSRVRRMFVSEQRGLEIEKEQREAGLSL